MQFFWCDIREVVAFYIRSKKVKKWIFLLLICLPVVVFGADFPDVGHVSRDVEVVHAEDASVIGRKRTTFYIYSGAQDFEGRAHTSLFVAKQAAVEFGFDYVKVFHLPANNPIYIGKGSYVASAEYAPDCMGIDGRSRLKHCQWEASAYAGAVDSVKTRVEVLWWTYRDEYTDEKALKRRISKELGGSVAPEDVHLPLYSLRFKDL